MTAEKISVSELIWLRGAHLQPISVVENKYPSYDQNKMDGWMAEYFGILSLMQFQR
jgi:hypothetical protein